MPIDHRDYIVETSFSFFFFFTYSFDVNKIYIILFARLPPSPAESRSELGGGNFNFTGDIGSSA